VSIRHGSRLLVGTALRCAPSVNAYPFGIDPFWVSEQMVACSGTIWNLLSEEEEIRKRENISTTSLLKPRVCVTPGFTFINLTCSPQGVFMCFTWISEQTAVTSLCPINWLFFRGFRKITKSDYLFRHVWLSVCPPVRLPIGRSGKTRLFLKRFSLNLIFQYFSKICLENSSFITIWRVLYMKTCVHLR
jgi:hypothetical protein